MLLPTSLSCPPVRGTLGTVASLLHLLMMAVSSLARIVGRSEFSKKYINYETLWEGQSLVRNTLTMRTIVTFANDLLIVGPAEMSAKMKVFEQMYDN
jgi:hypothetical protein